jgi:Peptidase family M1 domain
MQNPLLYLFLIPLGLSAQSRPQEPYFQQEVNYKIAVTLNDVKHELSGNIEFEYFNNSPDALPEIWVHLWGNAFKNRQSAFCRQKLRTGSSRFYFAEEKDLGRYKDLDFSADGNKIAWRFDPKNPDIAILSLAQPLAPGARVRIATPLNLKIPASFSRLGHVGTSYQMTQWYPKPAVYDRQGWHAMPYLDIGEFFSEFGAFDVTITLPENYVVGATGTCQTASEIEFLNKKEKESREKLRQGVDKKKDPFPESSAQLKTIRYTAEKVHDFAWFADKRFFVLKDTAKLASGKTVDCWAMFTNAESDIWQKGAFYVRRAVEFYSEKVGDYPWPQATAVHSALSAGGGMEYPMITVIGNSSSAESLDNVITHEVGHNWFYGVLASNERDHPYMDEGLNSYYEGRYMRQYYGKHAPVELPKFLYDPEKMGPVSAAGYRFLASDHKDTPPDSHSDDFTELGYGLQVYMKTALCLDWLEQSVGTEKMDKAMREYYRQWQFKHPYPTDLKAVFGEQNIAAGWFFEAMETQKRSDYALKKVTNAGAGEWDLKIERKGDLKSPFPVTAMKDGAAVRTVWYSAGDMEGSRYQTLRFSTPEADAFLIDQAHNTLEMNRKNDMRRTSGMFPGMEPWQIKLLAPFQDPRKNTIGILPWIGWNNADKTMIGLAFYNPPFVPRPMQVFLAPGFALGSKSLVGLADIRYRFYPDGFFRKVVLSLGAKTFNVDYNASEDYYTRYYRVMPQVRAELRSPSQAFSHALVYRTLFIGNEEAQFDQETFLGKKWRENTIHEFRYEGEQSAAPNPFLFQLALESQAFRDAFDRPANYLRGSLEWQQKFFYAPKRKFYARFFAGYFLKNTRRNIGINPPYNALSLNPQGFNDYKYDHLFLARNGGSGILDQQVSQSDGGFKGAFGAAFAGILGNSNNYILALNLKADLPKRLPFGIPIKPYFDIGYFDDASPLGAGRPSKEQLLWNGGLLLSFFKGGLEVYFPLFSSETLKRQYCEQGGGNNNSALFCGGNYLKMISWSLKINTTDPLKALQSIAQ